VGSLFFFRIPKVLVPYHDPMTGNPHRVDRVFPLYFHKNAMMRDCS